MTSKTPIEATEPDRAAPAYVMSAALAVTTASVLPVFLFGGLAVQMADDIHLTPSIIGWASGLYFTSAGATSILAGRLVEKWGATRCAFIGVGLAALCLLSIGLFVDNRFALIAVMVLAGPANGFGQLSSNAYLSRWAPVRHKGLFFGVKQAAIPLCTFITGLSVPAIALVYGWRAAFVLAAAASVCAMFLIRRFHGPSERAGRSVGQPVRDRRLILMMLVALCGAIAATSLGPFLATYAVAEGNSRHFAGILLLSGGFAGIVARTVVGGVADRWRGGELNLTIVMMGGGIIGTVLLAISTTPLIIVGTVFGFALGWAWPGLHNLATTKRYAQQPGAATGFTQTGVYLGGAIGPIGFGAVVEYVGWTAAWLMSSSLFILAIALLWAVKRIETSHGDSPRSDNAG